ncbi:putative chromatin regulator PHD family [Helianthus annuus]|nr:putative chromatin regulator PHD family [Helianthus annuus]
MKSRSHRLPTISDTPDDWGDESWVVDCVCGVDFDDGEEMVDCDECGVWVHTRCSRYVKSEKLFACDKCKSKKLRKESEETEVAQLLVELPTKTLRMENPYSVSFPAQNPFQVCSEIPLEEKVHVHGIPGGDTSLFKGVSSVFSPQLWKCTGYVPKKFNYQYREFPCWDNKRDDDDDNNNNNKKKKEEIENHASDSNGADALFSLSKENGGLKAQVNGSAALDMGPPTTDTKKQEVENNEGRRARKEKSLLKPIVIHTGDHKKDDSKMFKDQNRKKKLKSMEKDEDSKKTNAHASDSVPTTSSDAKQSESNEGKGVKVLKTDTQSYKHENPRAEVQTNHKSDDCLDNNNPLGNVSVDDSRINSLKEAKQMEENEGNQIPPSVEICNQTEDGVTSSIPNLMDTSTIKHEAGHDAVDDANNNGRTYSRSNGTRSNNNNLEKVDSALSSELDTTVEIKSVENNHSQNNLEKFDSSKKEDDIISASIEVKKDDLPVSQKVQNADKTSVPHIDSTGDEPACGPTQTKTQIKGSESSTRVSSEGQSKSHKVTLVKSSAGKSSSSKLLSVPDKAKYSNTDDRNSSGKQKVSSDNISKSKKDNNASSEILKTGDNSNTSEKPKKLAKDIPKSSSTSILKSSHLSKSSSHAHVSKKNSSDLKDSSADSANSSRSESGAHELNRSTSELSVKGEKASQINRQPAPKNQMPHSVTSAAALSDEELALLLHQELNSSPRVPRVPRMRQAGSLPQLASTTPTTSTLMKRTSSSGAKENGLVSRKKNKDLSNNGSSNSREFDGPKKVSNSRRVHEPVKSGSAKTVSSGPSSSNEANENAPQNASDEETGGPTHRTLPGLLADIMSKGKRMTYEELCNAVLPHWPNLRKHNGERYAYSSHSQAVLDCLRNRSEWARLVDRGPKTNAGRKRRKSDADVTNPESEDDYSTDRNTKDIDSNDFPKGKRKARKHRRLALQGRAIKDVRRRRKADVVSDEGDSSSDSSEESAYSDEEMQDGRTSGPNEASASSDETGTS